MNIGNPDVFKFVSISQTVLFNADRFTYNVKCAWYWLELEYSESYTGTVHQETEIDG